jgi:hypothetical protein
VIAITSDHTSLEIKNSIRRALNAESGQDKRTELAVAISKATGAYLMELG